MQNRIIRHCKSELNKFKSDKEYKKLIKERYKLKVDGKSTKIVDKILIKNSDSTLKHVDNKKCEDTFSQFVKNHNQCIEDIKTNKTKTLSSFGF